MSLDTLLSHLPRVFRRKAKATVLGILTAIALCFKDIDASYRDALTDASLLTARGFWLDFWAYFFRVARFPSEVDEDFRLRLRRTITNGATSARALLDAVRPYSITEPTLTEYSGNVLINNDYSGYDYVTNFLKNAFIIRLNYTPIWKDQKSLVVDKSFLDYNSFLADPNVSGLTEQRVKEVAYSVKMAGIKLVIKGV